ncbi:MAG: hypothetical protein LBG97_07365 [Coriobacteriales bacterium]|jgi:hypothetical protein|nr:hypothetical protein [Coriobacteriales bacterium]
MFDLMVSDEEYSNYIQATETLATAVSAMLLRYIATMEDVTATAISSGIVSNRLHAFTDGFKSLASRSIDTLLLSAANNLSDFSAKIDEKDDFLY